MRRFLCLVVFFTAPLFSGDCDLRYRAAAFHPFDQTLQKIYGNFWFESQIEGNVALCDLGTAFFDVTYARKEGLSLGGCNETKVRFVNAAVGLKRCLFTCSYFKPYVGLGVGAAYAHFDDHGSCLCSSVNQWSGLVLFKFGQTFCFYRCLVADIFCDVNLSRFRFNRNSLGVERCDVTGSGVRFGLGVGYRF